MFKTFPNQKRSSLSFAGQATKTQQHLKKFTDINYMIQRALGGDSSVYRPGGVSADISQVPDDLQEILNLQIRARDSYENLSADVRKKYPTPEDFFAACHDPEQRDALVKLGVINPPQASEPVEVKIVNQSQSVQTDVSSTDAAHA